MVLQYLLPERGHVYVGVYLRSADALMSQHGLDGTQVCTALQQGCGKRVTQGVGRDGLGDAGLYSLLLDHDEHHHPCQVRSPAVQEDIVFFTGLDVHEVTVYEPVLQFPDGLGRDGDQPFLRTLAEDPDVLFVEVEVAELQVDQFTDAQPAREQHLDDGSVALTFPLAQVDAVFQGIHLLCRQHLGQVCSQDGRLQQFRGVVVTIAVQLQETVERAYTTEDAAL